MYKLNIELIIQWVRGDSILWKKIFQLCLFIGLFLSIISCKNKGLENRYSTSDSISKTNNSSSNKSTSRAGTLTPTGGIVMADSETYITVTAVSGYPVPVDFYFTATGGDFNQFKVRSPNITEWNFDSIPSGCSLVDNNTSISCAIIPQNQKIKVTMKFNPAEPYQTVQYNISYTSARDQNNAIIERQG